MREIKFRAKTDNGQLVYGFYTQGGKIDPMTGETKTRHLIQGDMLYDIDPDTLGQFTGLYDKSVPPKPIYEGDIIRHKGCHTPYAVVFDKGPSASTTMDWATPSVSAAMTDAT